MNITLFGINWVVPKYGWLLLPVFILALILLVYRFHYQHNIINLISGGRSNRFICNFSSKRYLFQIILTIIGLLFLLLALFRPQWHKKEEIIAQQGRDVFVALDVSRSMLATDCEPNRLVCAKNKIKQLLHSLSCERVGLILFSGSAFVQCPLTSDYAAFQLFLDQVDVETISSGTTALDQVLKKAIETFKEMQSKKNKLLMIFTDGEDFSHNLSELKREAQEEGLHVFSVGIGTPEGAPIPLYDEQGKQIGHQRDTKGSVVISRLNDGILKTLSQDLGGIYIRFTQDNTDLHQLISQIKKFEKEYFEDKTVCQLEDKYHYFLFVSFICFVLEWLL